MAFDPAAWAAQRLGPQGQQPRLTSAPPINADQREWSIAAVKDKFGRENLHSALTLGASQGELPGSAVGLVNAQNAPLDNQSYPMPPRGDGEPVSMASNAPMYNNPQTGNINQSTGLVSATNEPLTATNTQPIQQQIIQGTFFQFPEEPDASGELWGNIGEGPNGYNWNINGSPLVNPYVPGWFNEQPPVLNFPPAFTEPQFRARHLFGFGSLISQWPDWLEVFQSFYGQALDAVEADFGGFIYPRVILTDGLSRGFIPGTDFDLEEREYDFNADAFYHWGWMRLRYTPMMAILNMNMVYPTGQMILQFPPAWIKPQMLSGEIRLVPPQGAISEVVLGPGGYMVMLVGGTLTDMPALIFVDYIAGMWPIPMQLRRAIELRLALMIFPVLSDAIAKGRADVMTTVDNVHYKQLFTTRSDVQGLTGRMTRYQQEYNQIMRNSRARYLGSAKAYSLTAL